MAAKPSFELRLRVLNAVHDAPGDTMRERIKCVAEKAFTDALNRTDKQTQLASMDLFYEGLIGADAVKRLSDQSQRYGRVVKSTGMKVE